MARHQAANTSYALAEGRRIPVPEQISQASPVPPAAKAELPSAAEDTLQARYHTRWDLGVVYTADHCCVETSDHQRFHQWD